MHAVSAAVGGNPHHRDSLSGLTFLRSHPPWHLHRWMRNRGKVTGPAHLHGCRHLDCHSSVASCKTAIGHVQVVIVSRVTDMDNVQFDVTITTFDRSDTIGTWMAATSNLVQLDVMKVSLWVRRMSERLELRKIHRAQTNHPTFKYPSVDCNPFANDRKRNNHYVKLMLRLFGEIKCYVEIADDRRNSTVAWVKLTIQRHIGQAFCETEPDVAWQYTIRLTRYLPTLKHHQVYNETWSDVDLRSNINRSAVKCDNTYKKTSTDLQWQHSQTASYSET